MGTNNCPMSETSNKSQSLPFPEKKNPGKREVIHYSTTPPHTHTQSHTLLTLTKQYISHFQDSLVWQGHGARSDSVLSMRGDGRLVSRSRNQIPLFPFCDLGSLSEIQFPHLQTTAKIITIPSQVVKKIYNDSDNTENAS